MKLLLDMYKSAPKEQRDKVQLMAAERKSKAEVCVSGNQIPPSCFIHAYNTDIHAGTTDVQ